MKYNLMRIFLNSETGAGTVEVSRDTEERIDSNTIPNPGLGSYYFPSSMSDLTAFNRLRDAMSKKAYDESESLRGKYIAINAIKYSTPGVASDTYLSEGGTKCPYCGSVDLVGGFVETSRGIATQFMQCSDCQKDWTDQYELTGYVGEPD